MLGHFLIDDAKVCELSATRQGRVSLGGFTYQASYAVARLASMLVRQPVLDLPDIPVALRYDWAEDLDEIDSKGHAIFTQCKRVETIGQPAKLADVLLSFAPKLLWTPADRQSELSFRIVCTDPRFRSDTPLAFSANASELDRPAVRKAFVETLATPPSARSDRLLWQADATAFGAEALFAAIWAATEAFYLRGDALPSDPSGVPLLAAERAALDLLVRWRAVDGDRQPEALHKLRALIHGNLVTFDPLSDLPVPTPAPSPRVVRWPDVHAELFALHTKRQMAFRVVTRAFLAEQRSKEKQMYVARPPQWADVVHGHDKDVRFVERDLTTTVLEKADVHILQPVARGSDERLNLLFILGAPGAGKSTLVRRAAALLVEREAATVADFGVNLGELAEEEINTIVTDLGSLATPERPVILVLDDPFFADSGWDRLLTRLAHARLPVGVLGASPDYLYERFGTKFRHDPFHMEEMTLAKPSTMERQTLSRLHGRDVSTSSSEDDFLVLAMEAAAGEPFSAIVARIWTTLNDGKPIDPFEEPEKLSWPVRAFLITCYFHRVYQRCPEALLREALARGQTATPTDYDYRLRQLTSRNGWKIFSIQEPAKWNERHQGRTIGAGHHRIAAEAWRMRPVPAFDVAAWIIPASILSNQVFAIPRLGVALLDSSDPTDAQLAARIANAWSESSHPNVGAASLSAMAGFFMTNGAQREAESMIPALRRRVEQLDDESWIAALQLRYLSSTDFDKRTFPEGVDLAAVIEVADFSRASGRAVRFAKALGKSPLYTTYIERLLKALDGSLSWELPANIMPWFLARMPVSGMTATRLHRIRKWLDANPDDSQVRTKFLDVVAVLASDDLREQVLNDTSVWLAQHPEDSSVRVRFLGSVEELPANNALRRTFIDGIPPWLARHPDDRGVRVKFLEIVKKLHRREKLRDAVIEDTARWLEQHPHDTAVRASFLSIGGSTDIGLENVARSAALLDEHRGERSWSTVAGAMVQPYLRATRSASNQRGPATKTLLTIRESIIRWYDSVGARPPNLDPALPKSDSPAPRRGFKTVADALRRALRTDEK